MINLDLNMVAGPKLTVLCFRHTTSGSPLGIIRTRTNPDHGARFPFQGFQLNDGHELPPKQG